MYITRERKQNYGFLEMTNIYNEMKGSNQIDFFMLNGYADDHSRNISLIGIMHPDSDNSHAKTIQSIRIDYNTLGIKDNEYISNFHADYNSEILRLTISSHLQEVQ